MASFIQCHDPSANAWNVSVTELEVHSCEVNTFILFNYFVNLGPDMFAPQSRFFSKSFLTLIASLSCSKDLQISEVTSPNPY